MSAAPRVFTSPVVGPLDDGQGQRLIIVSNRLPFAAVEQCGEYWLRPSDGGLASALRGIHARSKSLWIGSTGTLDVRLFGGALRKRFAAARLVDVPVSPDEVNGFYRRYSNGILWPLLHGMEPPVPADREGWEMYRAVNTRFADVIADHWRDGDTIWVHDYQLMLLPAMLRERLPQARIGFFLHTPMPGAAEMERAAEWPDLAAGMLGADVVGFQTDRDRCRFAGAIPSAIGDATPRLIACPIGVDYSQFAGTARRIGVRQRSTELRASMQGPLFVGIDRLDYTKGIPERLLAFERLLNFEPELRHRARFIQIAVPSRDGVGGYDEIRREIETIVARINDQYATAHWQPVEYRCGAIDTTELVALYCAADVMVVTSKRDGMNLVAKEFVASRADGTGVLVLSRAAGAAEELKGALLIDPNDVESIMTGLRRALFMSAAERRSRMRRLRDAVRANDVYGWADRFLNTLSPPERVTAGPKRS